MNAKEVRSILMSVGGAYAHIPEFTYNGLGRRIDLLRINTKKRKAIGFEIKVSRADFKADKKWNEYAQFCSTLSIACPAGLIAKNEVLPPYGLVWVRDEYMKRIEWVRRPQELQHTDWNETYVRILEQELVRLTDCRFPPPEPSVPRKPEASHE